eukprot:TRINITY_DN10919_c0_g1_i2.p1 TRINITY_DN10919_c0_g1~~TRINITY_DN10919_c0_g1_i2.p1  ORF type:complete len:186 (+),score=38.73 TRINITY_DN10919_c0_g1_i2:78-635(+)
MSVEVEPVQRRRVQPRKKDVTNLKLAVVGDCNVGKTALVKAFCKQGPFSPKYDPTPGADPLICSLSSGGRDYRFNVWDTSGDSSFVEIRNEFYKEANGVVLVFDVTCKKSFLNLDLWVAEASRFSQGSPNCVVAATKVDIPGRLVTEQNGREWARSKGFSYYEVSAAMAMNVEQPFLELSRCSGM